MSAGTVTLRYIGAGGSLTWSVAGKRVLLRPGVDVQVRESVGLQIVNLNPDLVIVVEQPTIELVEPEPVIEPVIEPEPVIEESALIAADDGGEDDESDTAPLVVKDPSPPRKGAISVTDLTRGGKRK